MRVLNKLPEVGDVHLSGPVVARSWVQIYWPWAVVISAWSVVLLATLTNHSELVDHDYLLERSGLPWLAALALFLICWQVMTAAMMVPSTLPLLHPGMHGAQRLPSHAQAIFLIAYSLIWSWFAAAAFLADTSIHVLVEVWPWLSQHTEAIGATTLAVAGIYQLSPWKRATLAACQTSIAGATRHPSIGAGSAWRSGLYHGLACLGSGWALMLVMFGLGVGGLVWMLALTVVMVTEKATPARRWITPIVGLALLALAVVWWAHPVWLPTANA